jgi:MSHA biogenesis protein MshN
MSLINQMLQDLEARRASGAELALVPRYVRALPRETRSRAPWWFAGVGILVGLGGAAAWHFTSTKATVAPSVPLAASASPPQVVQPLSTRSNIPASTVAVAEPERGAPLPLSSAAVLTRDAPPSPAASQPAPVLEPARMASAPPVRDVPETAPTAPGQPAVKDARDRRGPRETPAVVQAPSGAADIDKRQQNASPQMVAESEYRDGTNLLHQGRSAEAQEKFKLALNHLPGHGGARQALVALLLQARRTGEAEQVLREGLSANPAQPALAMALARMQVDRGDTTGGVETLQRSASAAVGSADYSAFLAALLQRQSRHSEAVEHYQSALSLAPGSSLWSMGLGISLQALNRQSEARGAYQRALSANSLTPELQAFVSQQLKQLH